ncbi:hypothetical protein GF324_05060, partial [bacterium]|nr:hypothetical protein [bacterium]
MVSQHRVVIDWGSWDALHIPALHEAFSLDGVLYLHENGITAVQYTLRQLETGGEPSEWYLDTYLRLRWKHLGTPGKDWDERDLWEKICFDWSSRLPLAKQVASALKGTPVAEFRVEDLFDRNTDSMQKMAMMLQVSFDEYFN